MYENTLNGQVVDGRVVLDPFAAETTGTTEDGATDPGDSFVAVNAPFDPVEAEMELEVVEA